MINNIITSCDRCRSQDTKQREFYLCPSYWVDFDKDGKEIYRSGPFSNPETTRNLVERSKAIIWDVRRKYRDKAHFRTGALAWWRFTPCYRSKYRSQLGGSYSPRYFIPGQTCSAHNNGYYSAKECRWATRAPYESWMQLPWHSCKDTRAIPSFYAPLYEVGETFTESTDDWLRRCAGELPNARARATEKLSSVLSGRMPDMLAFVGELREVATLIQIPKKLSDAWFSYGFGWKPTISDVRDIRGNLKKQLERARKLLKGIRSGLLAGRIIVPVVTKYKWYDDKKVIASFKTMADWCVSGSHVDCPRQGGFTVTERTCTYISVMMLVGIECSAAQTLFDAIGTYLRAINALGDLTTLWEVTPMSWLVDYFLPLQGYLRELSIRLHIGKWDNCHILDGAYSFMRLQQFEHDDYTIPCQRQPVHWHTSLEEYVRIPWGSEPASELASGLPHFRLPKNWSQIVNVAALSKAV